MIRKNVTTIFLVRATPERQGRQADVKGFQGDVGRLTLLALGSQ